MVFSGIPFLYFFLPILLLFYFVSPDKIKNPVLLLFSLIFYASGEPKNIIVMLVTVLIAYCAALWFSKLSGKAGRRFCGIGNTVASGRFCISSIPTFLL